MKDLFPHFYKLTSNELFIDFESFVLFRFLLSFQQNPLQISIKQITKTLKLNDAQIKSDLKFIASSGLIDFNFAISPDDLLQGLILITFDEAKLNRIVNNSFPKSKPQISNCVYVLRNSLNQFKIGRTNNLERRIKTLSTSYSDELTLVLSISTNDAVELEKNLHHHFKHKRIQREWFNLDDNDLDYLFQLQSKFLSPKLVKVFEDDDDLVF